MINSWRLRFLLAACNLWRLTYTYGSGQVADWIFIWGASEKRMTPERRLVRSANQSATVESDVNSTTLHRRMVRPWQQFRFDSWKTNGGWRWWWWRYGDTSSKAKRLKERLSINQLRYDIWWIDSYLSLGKSPFVRLRNSPPFFKKGIARRNFWTERRLDRHPGCGKPPTPLDWGL